MADQLTCEWKDVTHKVPMKPLPKSVKRWMRKRTHESFMRAHRQEEWLAGLDDKLADLREGE